MLNVEIVVKYACIVVGELERELSGYRIKENTNQTNNS